MHVHTRWFQMTPKVDITTPSCFQPHKKRNTPSPPPFITDYKLSYKNCNVAISVRPIVSKWVFLSDWPKEATGESIWQSAGHSSATSAH